MAKHAASIIWDRDGAPFLDNRYSRKHRWTFDGGIEVTASSSPHVVPVPFSLEAAVDPEEAFVASLSSCHMLWFLSLAANAGYIVERYQDDAEGVMGKDAEGRVAMLEVSLRPVVTFTGPTTPDAQALTQLHHQAHESCFIANSVRTRVHCTPQRT